MNDRSFKYGDFGLKMQTHRYLGFLALVGIYKLPAVLAALRGAAPLFGFANLLWFLWLLYPAPVNKSPEAS